MQASTLWVLTFGTCQYCPQHTSLITTDISFYGSFPHWSFILILQSLILLAKLLKSIQMKVHILCYTEGSKRPWCNSLQSTLSIIVSPWEYRPPQFAKITSRYHCDVPALLRNIKPPVTSFMVLSPSDRIHPLLSLLTNTLIALPPPTSSITPLHPVYLLVVFFWSNFSVSFCPVIVYQYTIMSLFIGSANVARIFAQLGFLTCLTHHLW